MPIGKNFCITFEQDELQLVCPLLPCIDCCLIYLCDRFEPDMLAFSGCYYGGGDKERYELGEIRKRWETLPVRLLTSMT